MLGYGIITNIGLILALFGLFKNYFLYLLLLLIIILSRKKIKKHLTFLKSKKLYHQLNTNIKYFFQEYKFLKLIIIIWLLLLFSIAFMPWVMFFDGLAYHIPFGMDIITDGHGSYTTETFPSYKHLPQFVELLYAITAIIFKNWIIFKIIQYSALLLILLIFIDFYKSFLKNQLYQLFFIIITLANMPLVEIAIRGGAIDIFTVLYGISSSLIIIELTLNNKSIKEKKYFILSAIFLGVSVATKYIGLFFVIINFIFLIYLYTSNKKNVKYTIKKLFIYSIITAIFGGFWYFKNLIINGNPFSPMFTENSGLKEGIEFFQLDITFLNFFLFPFAFWGLENIIKLPFALLNALFVSATYILGIFLIIIKKITKTEILLFALAQIYLLILFPLTHQSRFSISAMIILNLLLINFIYKIIKILINKFPQNKRAINNTIYVFICLFAILMFIGCFERLKPMFSCLANTKECMAAVNSKSFYAIEYINENLKNKNIINYWTPYLNYTLKNNNKFFYRFCLKELTENNSKNTIEKCFQKNNVEYLIDSDLGIKFAKQSPKLNKGKEKIQVTEYFISNAEIIYEIYDEKLDINTTIYQLKK